MAKGMIYKYRLEPRGKFLAIESVVDVLHVDMQHGQPTVWALVDPTSKPARESLGLHGFPLVLRIYATGEMASGDHFGTFRDGSFVWHVFGTRVADSEVLKLEASGVLRFERVPELVKE